MYREKLTKFVFYLATSSTPCHLKQSWKLMIKPVYLSLIVEVYNLM